MLRLIHLLCSAVFVFAAVRGTAVLPEFTVDENGVHIKGVGPDNPIIYDNDWWYDVFDNNYLWAQASLGAAKLVGTVVSRDMWEWKTGYQYPMKQCVDDADKAIKVARDSGLKNIPDATRGSSLALEPPASGKIEDTKTVSTPGSELIAREAMKATPEKPLILIVGGPMTTVANAILTHPEIAPNVIVFGLTTSHGGYNGKDAWAPYVVAKKTRYIEWATRQFWERGSLFKPEHFKNLPDNPFCNEMKRFIGTDLGDANQLGDGAPLVWLWDNRCWTGATTRSAKWSGDVMELPEADTAASDVLDIPRSKTDLNHSREEFFRAVANPTVYAK
jgi:hypothetical protein